MVVSMRKTLLILATVAVLGMLAAYINPLGPEKRPVASRPAASSPAQAATGGTPAIQPESASTYNDGSFQGGDFASQYGDVQVSVSIQHGKIADVTFDQLTAFDSHSREINDFAAPQLKDQTLSAQSAQIDGVSGATYTSTDYIRSLQSALDKARV